MRIAIIGSGVVGQATGFGLSAKGHDVTFYDIDEHTLYSLRSLGYHTSESVDHAVDHAEVIMIMVPTPTTNGGCDLSCVLSAARQVGQALADQKTYKVVALL